MKSSLFALKRLTFGISIALLPIVGFSANSAATSAQAEHTPGSDLVYETEIHQAAAPAKAFSSVTTASSVLNAADKGKRARTHYYLHNPLGVNAKTITDLAQPAPEANPTPHSSTAEYPASLACIYQVGPSYPGCVPTNNSAYNATGGSGAIAIVIAYDNPTVLTDLQYFSSFFGLPAPNLQLIKMNNSCSTPAANAGWALESAMDTQWAHAMAPGAKIILVEACSNSYADLFAAEQTAAAALVPYGGGVVSNSWGGAEFSGETSYDSYFHGSNWKNTSFIFSSGDAGGVVEYPSASPWVVAAGGTTINRNPSTLAFASESCWSGAGGGTSVYETYSTTFGVGTGPATNYQYPLFGQSSRRVPDISFNADPASGAWVRYSGGWQIVGGTSLAAPSLAGIINNSNNRLGQAPANGGYYSNTENNLLYAELLTSKDYANNFYDVNTGSNGFSATAGWDYCTGVGSPRGRNGK